MDEIVREFITECHESMQRYEGDLLALERDPSSRSALLPNIFRVVHSIKGACGFLGFGRLETLTHAGESLLSGLRDGRLEASPEAFAGLFRMGDAINALLGAIESGAGEGAADFAALGKELSALAAGTPLSAAPAASNAAGLAPAARVSVPAGAVGDESDWSRAAATGAERGSAPMLSEGMAASAAPEPTPAASAAASEPAPRIGDGPALAERSVRVDVGLLDKLMNLVGELVLVRNQVLQSTRQGGDTRLAAASQQLNLITTELQEGIVKTRMQPIRNVWSKFPRLVREVSLACGKQVRLDMEGEDTELDKGVMEAIKDPLTHILRNSIDHGIEGPEGRRAAGKPVEGRILLKAYQKDGQVNIEVGDDGAGIDVQKVALKALDRNLVPVDRLAKMSEHELAHLIFLPGFSTADKVTNVSGRGVGMDVVKTNVERIGGSVDIHNRPGRGLTLRIRIPLTLAIIPALIVETGGQRFAVPQINVVEIVRLKESLPGRGVEWIQGTPVHRLRGDLIPLVRLGLHLGLDRDGEDAALGRQERFMAVLQVENRPFGVLVEAVKDTQEILVKPLASHLKSIACFAGATIMGDGRAALILDVPGLAQGCRLTCEQEASAATSPAPAAARESNTRMLIVEVAGAGTLAIPLDHVERLEEIPPGAVESASGMEVVQSRGRIMPILRASRLLSLDSVREGAAQQRAGNLHVVACGDGDAVVGLVVERVLDIVDEPLELLLPAMRPGFRGSAILKGKTMDILELREFVRLALPRLAAEAKEVSA